VYITEETTCGQPGQKAVVLQRKSAVLYQLCQVSSKRLEETWHNWYSTALFLCIHDFCCKRKSNAHPRGEPMSSTQCFLVGERGTALLYLHLSLLCLTRLGAVPEGAVPVEAIPEGEPSCPFEAIPEGKLSRPFAPTLGLGPPKGASIDQFSRAGASAGGCLLPWG